MNNVYVAGVLVLALFTSCGGPLYRPGSAAQSAVTVSGGAGGAEGYLTVGDSVKLYYFAAGTGEPVLMVHGGPGYPFRAAWSALEPLSAHYRFLYFHQRGSGKSTRPVDRFTSKNYYANMQALESALGLAAQVNDIEAFRIALGVEKLTLVGHSFGGFLSALYASEYPDHVSKLVLVAPAEVVRMPMKHSGGLYESVREELPEGMKKEFDGFLKRFFDYGAIFTKTERELQDLNHEFIRYYTAAYSGGRGVPPESTYTAEEIAGWGQHAVFFSMGRKYDLSGRLTGVNAPTLIITGSGDLASEREILETYGKIPGARHVRLDAGHFSFEEDAQAFGKAVAEFLSSAR